MITVLTVLKLLGYINLSWLLIFSPIILYVLALITSFIYIIIKNIKTR